MAEVKNCVGNSGGCIRFLFPASAVYVFPNIIPQARRNSGGLLVLAGMIYILKLLDGLALVFGIDEAVNSVHV